MQQESNKKEHSGNDCCAPYHVIAPTQAQTMEMGRERERDQDRNKEPTVMESNLNSGKSAEFDL